MLAVKIQVFGGRGAYFNRKGNFVFSSNNKHENEKPKIIKVDNQTVIETLKYDDDIIPKGVEITDVHIFAGADVQSSFRNAKSYNDKYKLEDNEVNNWYHVAGKVESSKYIYDIHTVAHKKIGIVEMYIKHRSNKNES